MIRINLLPVRQVRKVQAGQRQILLLVMLILAEGAAMAFLYNVKSDDIEQKRRVIAAVQNEINLLKRQVGDYDRLERQRNHLLKQRNVINGLKRSRIGPVWALRELGGMLSSNGRPTFNQVAYERAIRRNPGAAFNARWNARRLWIDSFKESRSSLVLHGKAKDFDDVAEFLKRLQASKFFTSVKLGRNDRVHDKSVGTRVVSFSVTCKVLYRGG